MSRADGTNARANGTNPRARGTNKRALGTNNRRQGGVWKKAKQNGWTPDVNPPSKRMLPQWLRFEILKRDGFRCVYCGAAPADGVCLEVDHIKPKCDGGTDHPDNLTTSCRDCNGGKSWRLLDKGFI